jgi:hypothetical protein
VKVLPGMEVIAGKKAASDDAKSGAFAHWQIFHRC